ncbi:MAG: ion transporter, partial [Bacillota bacterium]|nr:ion transporter [Bacillota bacterium]
MRRIIYEMIEKAEDENKLSKWYDIIMILCILLSVFPLCFQSITKPLILLDYIMAFVFIIDYGLRWMTADYKLRLGKLSFLKYPFTPFAIIDLVAILSSLTPLHSGFRILRVIRLLKSLRALKLLRYSKGFYLMTRVFRKEKDNLLTVFYMVMGYILLSALVIFQVEPQTFQNYFDAVYWATITLTSIGYGDFTPVTYVGKAVAILSSFVGIAVF